MNTCSVNVALGARSYQIDIGSKLLDDATGLQALAKGPDVVLVSNETVAPLYADKVLAAFPNHRTCLHVIPDGEQFKNLQTLSGIYDALIAHGANRDTTLVALGGGVVGDIAGLAAATYQRGVSFIQIPTTLLAQVDSSVGGKTAINHEAGKNLIGAFHQPAHVLIDTDTLQTLPDREYCAGLAEVIKYGLLGDAAFFDWLEANMPALRQREHSAVQYAVQRSCECKADIVRADETEQGQRALLNLGHTFGHAIEHAAGYGEYLHGEAVGIGMIMAAVASELPTGTLHRVTALIESAGLPVSPPALGADTLWQAMQLDKKVSQGKVKLILLRDIGQAYVSADYAISAVQAALQTADG
ncbi:MAG: 3-dehydroquinate synthase [Pseudomonadota bacterium]